MPSSNLEPLEFLNVVGRTGTTTRGEKKRDVYLSGDISDSRKRRSLCAQPATADVISPIGTSGREGPISVLDTSVKVHASGQMDKRNHNTRTFRNERNCYIIRLSVRWKFWLSTDEGARYAFIPLSLRYIF